MHKHGSKYFACRHPSPPDPRAGVKRSNTTFSEHGHVAYQIKGNHNCRTIVANVLPAVPNPISTPDPGFGVKRSNSTLSEQGHVANIFPAALPGPMG